MTSLKLKTRKGWYFKFQFQGKTIKKECWKNKPMNSKNEAQAAESECLKLLEMGIEPTKIKGKLTEIEIEQLIEDVKHNSNITLYQLVDEYVNYSKSNLKPSTLNTYQKFKRNYLIYISNKSVYNLYPNDILEWKNKVIKNKKSITDDSINRMLNIMKSVLNYGMIMYNLPGKLQLCLIENYKSNNVKSQDQRSKFITHNDFKILCDNIDDEYTLVITKLIYYTGLRISELAALTFDDINNNIITINKDYVRVSGLDYIQTPKSEASIRKIVMDEDTSSMLHEYINNHKQDGTIFHKKTPYLNQQRYRRKLNEATELSGLTDKYIISPHTLRHSHNSNLRLLGIDAVARGVRLGNTAAVNEAVYTHSNFNEQIDIANRINKKSTE